MSQTSWAKIRDSIFSCRECLRQFPKVDVKKVRLDTYEDPNSVSRVQLLFVSEAPPGGQTLGNFFHIPEAEDGLRTKLFIALAHTDRFHGIDALSNHEGLELFIRGGCYLLPSFNYPCSKIDSKSGKVLIENANPTFEQLSHSAAHLRDETIFIQPTLIFTLGKSALFTVLQAFGSTTQKAGQYARSFRRTSRINPIVGSTFPINHGENCEVWIENWPRIATLKRPGFKRLVRDLQIVLDNS